jgi:SAM-dependent methyltransferase
MGGEKVLAALHRRVYPDRPFAAGEEAAEHGDLEHVLAKLPEARAFVTRLLRRLEPYRPLQPGDRILDVGAAQGVTLVAFLDAGLDARGVEPWGPAIEISKELAARTDTELEIVSGVAESLPYGNSSFDLVFAYSVLEHVTDPRAAFREAFRVLADGGVFFFSTNSRLCPRQPEIRGFPLFPWYPPTLQRRIMDWTTEQRPWLVGNTATPARHWFRHRWVKAALYSVGFRDVVNRWQLRPLEEQEGWRRRVLAAAKVNGGVQLIGDLLVPGMEYAALK